MLERIIIAGAGGQGVMLLGKVLAEAAMKENKFVTWLPCYGAEVRGGTAYCMVVISDKEIGSPYVDKADILIIMNMPSLERFKGSIDNERGLCIINSSLVRSKLAQTKHFLKYPFTEIAAELGNTKIANMVALGCLIAQKKIVDKKSIIKVMEEIAPADKKELIEINKQALLKGIGLNG
jgi:2-oxoglutarate ferredoxin oxidoreductase subunit gamma